MNESLLHCTKDQSFGIDITNGSECHQLIPLETYIVASAASTMDQAEAEI